MFRWLAAALIGAAVISAQDKSTLGIFQDQGDVGAVQHAGSGSFDPASQSYTLSGSGENMWFAKDEFHFVWRRMTAKDVSLAATIEMLGDEGEAHRKAVLMIRQSLDNDSAYVDAARHAEGLTSLQYRPVKGGITREIESSVSGPARLRIEKQGDRFYMWVGPEQGEMEFSGGSVQVEMKEPFFVGIGVCSHSKDQIVKAAFKDLAMTSKVRHSGKLYSTVETVLLSGDARSGVVTTEATKRPGWSEDGRSLTYEVNGQRRESAFTPLRTAAPIGAPVAKVPATGKTEGILSPDGVYTLKLLGAGRGKREVTLQLTKLANGTSKDLATFTGTADSLGSAPWSPDGKRIVFVSYQKLR